MTVPPRQGPGLPCLVAPVVLFSLVMIVATVVFMCSGDTTVEVVAEQPGQHEGKEVNEQPAGGPRRLKVAGNEGYWIVVYPDGSSAMEGPDGKQRQLTPPGVKPTIPTNLIPRSVEQGLAQSQPRRAPGQIVVCDTGVVDVPQDAVITFVGRDKVITHGPDGSSAVYYTDGRVEQRDRVDRRPTGGPSKKEP